MLTLLWSSFHKICQSSHYAVPLLWCLYSDVNNKIKTGECCNPGREFEDKKKTKLYIRSNFHVPRKTPRRILVKLLDFKGIKIKLLIEIANLGWYQTSEEHYTKPGSNGAPFTRTKKLNARKYQPRIFVCSYKHTERNWVQKIRDQYMPFLGSKIPPIQEKNQQNDRRRAFIYLIGRRIVCTHYTFW